MADYFTFPHNKTYEGNLAAHNSYEAELKNRLRECILSGAADSQLEEAKQFESFEELVEYIRERHAYYLESPRCIADDIRFILRVCYQVVQGIFQLCVRKQFHMGGQPAVTCLTVYKKPQCVRALWLFYVMVNSKKSYKNMNKK